MLEIPSLIAVSWREEAERAAVGDRMWNATGDTQYVYQGSYEDATDPAIIAAEIERIESYRIPY